MRVQPTVALFILTPCLTGLIRRELNNSEVHDPSFCRGTLGAPLKDLFWSPIPTLEVGAVIVLTNALRRKLWVYDVVSSLVGLHHMEAAVAPAVERPSEQKLDPLIYGKTSFHQDDIFYQTKFNKYL